MFFRIFFYKCQFCIVWNWFMAKNIPNLQKYLLWGNSKWQQIKQVWTEVYHQIFGGWKFIEECVMCIEKDVLEKKVFSNRLNIGFLLQTLVEKPIHGIQTDSPVKKKFWVQQLVKVMLTVFWNIKGPITTDFFKICKSGESHTIPQPNFILWVYSYWISACIVVFFRMANFILFIACSWQKSAVIVLPYFKHW